MARAKMKFNLNVLGLNWEELGNLCSRTTGSSTSGCKSESTHNIERTTMGQQSGDVSEEYHVACQIGEQRMFGPNIVAMER